MNTSPFVAYPDGVWPLGGCSWFSMQSLATAASKRCWRSRKRNALHRKLKPEPCTTSKMLSHTTWLHRKIWTEDGDCIGNSCSCYDGWLHRKWAPRTADCIDNWSLEVLSASKISPWKCWAHRKLVPGSVDCIENGEHRVLRQGYSMVIKRCIYVYIYIYIDIYAYLDYKWI